ncbi:MAG TPA: BREX-4 system phosphatase PglZ [Bacteroidales bacterium]|nr:BREX-4 system phosphatase PglZ [Bacteroidales bacterium]
MKLVDKIKEFSNLDDLVSEIESDKHTRNILSNRYPVRLIFLQRFETFRALIERLDKIGINICHIERELPHPDGWITKDSLINIVKNINVDTAIVPFSELVRFYSSPELSNFFHQVLLIENSDISRRIYLPLIGIEQRFEKDFFQDFTRSEESAPFWKISNETPNSIKVFLSADKIAGKLMDIETIPNTEEWLKFWKKKSPCDVICYSKPLNIFYNNTLPDSIFFIEKFENIKNLIEKVLNKVIPVPFIIKDNNHWEKLSSLINKDFTTFTDCVKKHFNVVSITQNNFLDFWLKSDNEFDKWLLQHFVVSNDSLKQTYLSKVLISLPDYTDHTLLKYLFLAIFSLDTKESFISERLNLIKQYECLKSANLSDDVINELKNKIKELPDKNLALMVCTGCFQFEKEFIFALFVSNEISDYELLSQRFPDIANYISSSIFDNTSKNQEWIYEYLAEYKKSKLSDKVSDNLNKILLEFNGNSDSFYNWYHSFESLHSILHTNKVDKVIWIDALGIEWVSFIENYLTQANKDLRIVKKLVGVANLPTSTEHNRFSDAKYIQDFDSFIHNNTYSYPDLLIKEMEEIKRILNSCLILDSNQTYALVSDHGLTALSRLASSKKYGKEDSHEGRFIEVKGNEHTQDSDYIYHKSDIDQKEYLIALKHNSLGKKPIREAHGGCTPEEVLVPLLIISNKKDTNQIDYSVTIEKTEISKKEPLLSFTIMPKPQNAYLKFSGKKQKLNFNNNTHKWEIIMDKSLSGELSVAVLVDNFEKSFTINIKSGLIEEDLF